MKAERESEVAKGKGVTWAGPSDLSATCRMARDSKFLYLDFSVKDNICCLPESKMKNAWEKDSIQFAFDPTMEGKSQTEILIVPGKSGKGYAYKLINFWTSELPTDLTRRGLMRDVDVKTTPIAGGMEYKIKIPLRELYPLTTKTNEFGFSWLVNDNDGQGRKYIQWSSGIGPDKKASLFGLVRCRK